jgi:hypothetical protein
LEIRYYSITLYKEIGFAFITLLTLYLFSVYRHRSTINSIMSGALAAAVGMIGAQFNAWFLAPLFFGLVWITLDIKSVKRTKENAMRNIPFIAGFIIMFIILSLMFASLYESSTGNRHVFPNNGAALLFAMNAPTGCEGVTFTLDNNQFIPNEDFMIPFAKEKGYEYESLEQFDKAKLQQEYVIGYIMRNPGRTMDRIMPFMQLWLFPSVRESQRVIMDEKSLNNYLWLTFIMALGGIIALIIRKEGTWEWAWIIAFYAVATLSYMMTYYLMRYRIYFKFFELLLASYFIVALIMLIDRNAVVAAFLQKRIVGNIIVVGLSIVIIIVLIMSLSPLMGIRSDTSYAMMLSDFRGEEMKIDFFDPEIARSMGVIVTEECSTFHLSPVPAGGVMIRQGLTEYYPVGEIFRRESDITEWAIRRAGTRNVKPISRFGSIIMEEGRQDFNMNINNEVSALPLTIKNGIILSPDFMNYYIVSCT